MGSSSTGTDTTTGTGSGVGNFLSNNAGPLLGLAGQLAPMAGATPLAAPLAGLGGMVSMYQQPGKSQEYQDAMKAQKAVSDYKPGVSTGEAPPAVTDAQQAAITRGAPKNQVDIASNTVQSTQPLIAAMEARRQSQKPQFAPQDMQVGPGPAPRLVAPSTSSNADVQKIIQLLTARQTQPFGQGGFGGGFSG